MKLILEIKTSGEDISEGSPFWVKLTLDLQCSMYIAAAREMGHDVGGILYDVLKKTGLRPKKDEVPGSYEARIIQQIGEEPDRYYRRGVIVRTQDEMLEHDADMWQTAELIRLARNSQRWPRYVGGCMVFNRPCDYFEVCAGSRTIDSNHYETRPPMKKGLPILSPSAVNVWRQCPRKYQFAYEMRRRPKADVTGARYFGKVIHKAIEVYSHHGIDAALATLDGDPFDVAHARALVRGYHARWFDAKLNIIATEQEFTRPLRNPDTGAQSRTFELGGIVDAVVEEKWLAG